MTDVDGTLTDEHRRLTPGAISAVADLTRRGWPVILATGNVLPIALALHRSLGLRGPIVAENGGLIYDRVDGREVVTCLADRKIALRAFRAAKRAGLPVRPLFTDRWRETEVAIEPTVSVRRVREAAAGIPVDVEATGFAIHFMERGVGKLAALERALRPYDLRISDCIVAGDGDNDAAMLRAAGWGFSFPTGSPSARRSADYVSRASGGFGFVEALKRVGAYDPTSRGTRVRNAGRPVRSMR